MNKAITMNKTTSSLGLLLLFSASHVSHAAVTGSIVEVIPNQGAVWSPGNVTIGQQVTITTTGAAYQVRSKITNLREDGVRYGFSDLSDTIVAANKTVPLAWSFPFLLDARYYYTMTAVLSARPQGTPGAGGYTQLDTKNSTYLVEMKQADDKIPPGGDAARSSSSASS